MNVPFLDLTRYTSHCGGEMELAISRVNEIGNYILGNEVKSFEREFSAYCGAKHCIGVASGLDAITLTLRALGVKPGDEILVPSNTYIATWLAVSNLGAVPIPVEPRDDTYNIDPEKIEKEISEKTRGIIIVDLYGQPADASSVLEIAEKYDIFVIDDAAQSHGAMHRGQKVGSHLLASAFSFYPTKNLGALGDGGAVVTSDCEIEEKVRLLRNYGTKDKYVSLDKGINSRLDEIQAAVLRVKLKNLDAWNTKREELAKKYSKAFDGTNVKLPYVPTHLKSSWHLYVIGTELRDNLRIYLQKEGVDTIVHYPIPPHKQPAYAKDMAHLSFPVAEKIAEEVVSLPLYPYLTEEEHSYVIDKVLDFLSYSRRH